VQRLAIVEMLVEAGHETRPGQVGHGDREFIIDVAGPGWVMGTPVEVAALGLVLAHEPVTARTDRSRYSSTVTVRPVIPGRSSKQPGFSRTRLS
jgi:hypothetical protein